MVYPPGAQQLMTHIELQTREPMTSAIIIFSARKDFSNPVTIIPEISQSPDGWTTLKAMTPLVVEHPVKKWFMQVQAKPKKFTVRYWSLQFELNPSYFKRLYLWWQQRAL